MAAIAFEPPPLRMTPGHQPVLLAEVLELLGDDRNAQELREQTVTRLLRPADPPTPGAPDGEDVPAREESRG